MESQTKQEETIALSHKSRGMSWTPEHGTKQYEMAMRKFNMVNKETCKSIPQEIPRIVRPREAFPTGSEYAGSWNELGMSGKGVYEFPLSVHTQKLPRGTKAPSIEPPSRDRIVYKGEFDNGIFHGTGELYYPSGAILKGRWDSGKLIEKVLTFPDGLEYDRKDWFYCTYPDRRYTVEFDNGIPAAGDSYITQEKPPRVIPPGCYDTGDGFYEPKTQFICKYDDNSIIRAAGNQEASWIEDNCRSAKDEIIGPCPFLYEDWVMPMLVAEEPPPPCTRTRNYIEAQTEMEQWKIAIQTGRISTAGPYASKADRMSYHAEYRTATDFYKPAYMRGPSSRMSGAPNRLNIGSWAESQPETKARSIAGLKGQSALGGDTTHVVRHRSMFSHRAIPLDLARENQEKEKDQPVKKGFASTQKTPEPEPELSHVMSVGPLNSRMDKDEFEHPHLLPNW